MSSVEVNGSPVRFQASSGRGSLQKRHSSKYLKKSAIFSMIAFHNIKYIQEQGQLKLMYGRYCCMNHEPARSVNMENRLKAFEMWCKRRLLKISWIMRTSNEEGLRRMGIEIKKTGKCERKTDENHWTSYEKRRGRT